MDHLITIGIGVASPVVLGILGFMLKLYSKIALHEKQIEAHDRRIRDMSANLQKLDDKQYSIVKNIPR
tara:strand:+ start:363 stop:566 length:204 start_codon:yes stop_codon:yes gene_type:complete